MSDNPFTEESLFTCARRVMQYIRIDDERDGGLLSKETIKANERLARMVDKEDKRLKAGLNNGK